MSGTCRSRSGGFSLGLSTCPRVRGRLERSGTSFSILRHVAIDHEHGHSIVTFLMVFLIQSTENRDTREIHLKLDELIHANQMPGMSL